MARCLSRFHFSLYHQIGFHFSNMANFSQSFIFRNMRVERFSHIVSFCLSYKYREVRAIATVKY